MHLPHDNITPFSKCRQILDLRCVFAIGSQHRLVLGVPTKTRASVVWCWASQPKHVRLWFGAGRPSQNTCVCGLVLGVPTKTRASVVWCCAPQPKHVRLWFGAGRPNQITSRIQNKEVSYTLLFMIAFFFQASRTAKSTLSSQ